MAHLHLSKRKCYEDEDAEILKQVSGRLITKDILTEKLAEHVEKVSFQINPCHRVKVVWLVKFYLKCIDAKPR